MSRSIRLVPAPTSSVHVPDLDLNQQAVVDHVGGPLLVLAGPGTGKTTTLVEAIVDRIENRGADPSSVLALTFSRKAAEQLRDRVTARLGRTVATPPSLTFHSFAYGLVRRFTPAELYTAPLRLLTAPQADVMVRELLDLHGRDLGWPPGLAVAARTKGFAREVAAVIARAREKGADHEQLLALGLSEQIPEFAAAGLFLQHYLDNLDDHGATDYPDLVRRAVIEAHAHRHELRREFSHVFVDEYQDTDPGQVALLQAVAGDGGNLIAVGDPHQSIYGFRGAQVRGIGDFASEFRTFPGEKAPTVVLSTTRRFGADLLAASQRVAARLPLVGALSAETRDRFAHPVAAEGSAPGTVEVYTYDTERAEVERIADLLRRAHLEDQVPWSEMAILVRSGRSTLPVFRRMLAGAGVPVDVAGDEIPLSQEPAVAPLLDALEVVVAAGAWDPDLPQGAALTDDQVPTEDRAEDLLLSALGGVGATTLRALGRALRQREVAAAVTEQRAALSSRALVARALVDPTQFDGLDPEVTAKPRALADLLVRARRAVGRGDSVEQVIWLVWSGTEWGERLRQQVLRGGASARRAHRDLDAVVALFDMASRVEESRAHTSLRTFLAEVSAQQIPGDTLVDKGVRGESVRLLTAHRSKGLEWRLVVVAHVQDGGWPDLRRRATLLGADRLGADRYGQLVVREDLPATAMLAEKRRLFYVACTRARERLVVTAVAARTEDGEQASRFLAELLDEDLSEPTHVIGRPLRPLTLAGLVAELRRTANDPEVGGALRAAAVRRLGVLRAEQVAGRALVPAADPQRWWGTHARTHAQTPVRPLAEPVRLSASTVTSLAECPAKWFLEREAGGAVFAGQAAGFGNLVHKIAEHVAAGELADADIDELMEFVDGVWDRLPFRTPWSREKERVEARLALGRFLTQHRAGDARTVLGTETSFQFTATLPDGEIVTVRGFADRIELDGEGRVVVVDLKTGKYVPTKEAITDHPQLGIYQYAVAQGAFDEAAGPGAHPGGAELWQLRTSTNERPKIQAQSIPDTDDEGWLLAERQLAAAAARIRSEEFVATPGTHCKFCPFQALCPATTSAGVIR